MKENKSEEMEMQGVIDQILVFYLKIIQLIQLKSKCLSYAHVNNHIFQNEIAQIFGDNKKYLKKKKLRALTKKKKKWENLL